jgi:hypothetical protein
MWGEPMREIFPGYYPLSDSDKNEIWNSATFVFDTNGLLNLYRYTQSTRDDFLVVLDKLAERIWLPYQVAVEFHENRPGVIYRIRDAYRSFQNDLSKTAQAAKAMTEKHRQYRQIGAEEAATEIATLFEKLQSSLGAQERALPDWLRGDDPVLDRVTSLFAGKVGHRPDAADTARLLGIAKKRFDANTPPGLRDKDKGGTKQYGDALIWLEILDLAKTKKTPIVFVTDDGKDDWWLTAGENEGQKLGPLPALRQELLDAAGVPLMFYSWLGFVRRASAVSETTLPQSAIDEAERFVARQSDAYFANEILSALGEGKADGDDRPSLVGDFRGSTVEEQLHKLFGEKHKLELWLDSMKPESKIASELTEALQYVNSRIDEKNELKGFLDHVFNSRSVGPDHVP